METKSQKWDRLNPEKRRAISAAWRKRNPEKVSVQWKEKPRKYKTEMIEQYGGKCQCCGESNSAFLTLDHVNNDGEEHRKVTGHGSRFYGWLRTRGWPKDGLRLLCFNCNCGRRVNGGACPHED